MAWDPGRLRSLVGKLALVPAGGSVSIYLEQNRKVAGLADDSTRTELAEAATLREIRMVRKGTARKP